MVTDFFAHEDENAIKDAIKYAQEPSWFVIGFLVFSVAAAGLWLLKTYMDDKTKDLNKARNAAEERWGNHSQRPGNGQSSISINAEERWGNHNHRPGNGPSSISINLERRSSPLLR